MGGWSGSFSGLVVVILFIGSRVLVLCDGMDECDRRREVDTLL